MTKNDIVNRLLRMYRLLAYSLSLLLFVLGAIFVLDAGESFVVAIWWISFVLSSTAGLVTLAGIIRLNVSGRN